MPVEISRGDIVEVALETEEMQKTRRCVVVQNDAGNRYSPRTLVVPVASIDKPLPKRFPVWVCTQDMLLLCDQIRTIDQKHILRVCGHLSPDVMAKVNEALKVSLALE